MTTPDVLTTPSTLAVLPPHPALTKASAETHKLSRKKCFIGQHSFSEAMLSKSRTAYAATQRGGFAFDSGRRVEGTQCSTPMARTAIGGPVFIESCRKGYWYRDLFSHILRVSRGFLVTAFSWLQVNPLQAAGTAKADGSKLGVKSVFGTVGVGFRPRVRIGTPAVSCLCRQRRGIVASGHRRGSSRVWPDANRSHAFESVSVIIKVLQRSPRS